ncbi:MAG: flagellin [Epsilonproteobacteria bacterium]|nr:flagellin [Campylobacterota bacterium]
MAISINTNSSALSAQRNMSQASQLLDNSVNRLATGIRVNSAADDAASLAISKKFDALVRSMGQGIQNGNEAIGMVQIADGGLQGINENLGRMRELSLRASNDTYSAEDRAIAQQEIGALMQSIDDIASRTRFGNTALLNGSAGAAGDGVVSFQIGADITSSQNVKFGDARSSAILSSGVDVTTQTNASTSIDNIDAAIKNVSDMRSTLGAAQNQLESAVMNTTQGMLNTASANSAMRDLDFGAESANFQKFNLLAQSGALALAQANQSSQSIMSLLR